MVQYTNCTLEEFNSLFDSKFVHLPLNLIAIGVINNNFYVYNIKKDNDSYSRFLIYINYWITNIYPYIKCNKYYFVLCIRDGYRERITYCNNLISYSPHINEFYNKSEIENVLLCHNPILHKNKYIFTFSKQISDNFSICIPDTHYIKADGYTNNLLKIINNNFIFFNNKINECIYRGKIENGTKYNFIYPDDKLNLNQRKFLKKLFNDNKIKNFDFNDGSKDMISQLNYKYILDVDGYSNTWDATVWKLYSGSVLLKTKSIWKQWYYDDLKEWIHYVPIENDFSDLNDKIQWCIENNDKCYEITLNAKKLVVDKLNWEKVKLDTINIYQKYVNECFNCNLSNSISV
jgi:hypothetical protein